MALKTCYQQSLFPCVISQHTPATKHAHKHLFLSGISSVDASGFLVVFETNSIYLAHHSETESNLYLEWGLNIDELVG